jgi:DNA-binding XRE family transcriptional regulator
MVMLVAGDKSGDWRRWYDAAMTERTAAGWHAYEDVGELLTELKLTGEEMARAQETTNDHVRAWHLAQVRTEQDRTQEEVAQAMAVTQPCVSAIECGELDTVTLSTLRATSAPWAGRSASSRTSTTKNTG